jgi:hypothetical protein
MAPWTFDMKFPLGTQFTFGSLTFVVGEDEDLKMLPQGQRQSISLLLSHLCDTYSGLDPFAGLYIRTVKLVRGYFDRDVHPPYIHQSIEFIFIGIVPQPRFI